MKKMATYKYNVKARLNREKDTYKLTAKVKGDLFESVMFALESVVRTLIETNKYSKEEFMKHIERSYEIIEEDIKNGK